MAEFSAAAELEVSVSDSSLRSARRQIENDLGDVEVGLAPSGGGGAVGAPGPEPATVDLARRQLDETMGLMELAQERNDLLEDLRGGLGGGGGGDSTNIFPVGDPRGLLGRLGGAAAGAAAAGAGGVATAGIVGAPLATFIQRLGRIDLTDPASVAFGEQADPANRPNVPDAAKIDLQVPEGFPPKLQLPQGQFPPELQIPQGFPPELQVPPGFPPELKLPPGVSQIPESIGIDVPSELEQLVGGNVDIGGQLDLNANVDLGIPTAGELQREVESIVQREFDELVRQLGQFDLNDILG